jgi:uncharacterized membrane protein YhfC
MDVFVRLLNSLIMILIPLILGMYLVRQWRLRWHILALGAVTFIGSQVFHIPFNQFVLLPIMENYGLLSANKTYELIGFGILAGLSAGFFEEGARYLVYRVWLKGVRRWKEAVLFGVGHGGIEAMVLGGLALYAFFQATAYRNADLAELVPAGQLELAKAQIEAYWSAPWYLALMGAVERLFAMIIQISLSVLVFQAVLRRKFLWWFLAVGWHTAVDAVAVIGIRSWGVFITEAVLAGFALLSLVVILVLRDQDEGQDPELGDGQEPLPIPDLPLKSRKLDLSRERLENSRYNDDA